MALEEKKTGEQEGEGGNPPACKARELQSASTRLVVQPAIDNLHVAAHVRLVAGVLCRGTIPFFTALGCHLPMARQVDVATTPAGLRGLARTQVALGQCRAFVAGPCCERCGRRKPVAAHPARLVTPTRTADVRFFVKYPGKSSVGSRLGGGKKVGAHST